MLGDKYIQQKTSFFGDLWKAFTTCKFVEEKPSSAPGALHWAKA
jgi:omega-6 fatty acid desaturase (delta-12 desaturase)